MRAAMSGLHPLLQLGGDRPSLMLRFGPLTPPVPQGNYSRADGAVISHRFLNSGNFLLKSNGRTRRMMDMWRAGFEFQV